MSRADGLALCLLVQLLAVLSAAAADVDATGTNARGPNSSSHRVTPVLLGAYDPHDALRDSDTPRIEHVFVFWQAVDDAMLATKMRLAETKGRTLLVTVEPYTKAANWRDGGDHLFTDIVGGGFDREITTVCDAIARYRGEHWIRWGHEMERSTDRYPWARGDASGYVAAYRYFVDACRKIAPHARIVWSPKGEGGLHAYYPGDDYVDLIGVSVWGLEKWDRERHGRPRSFTETFDEKYRRVAKFGKPVIIAEFGVAGRKRYRQDWKSEIRALSKRRNPFPMLSAIIYFYDKEPYHWPAGHGSPDWRIAGSELAP